jgi:hypothetical protein
MENEWFSQLLETEEGASVKTILVSNVQLEKFITSLQVHHFEDVAIIPFMVRRLLSCTIIQKHEYACAYFIYVYDFMSICVLIHIYISQTKVNSSKFNTKY